MARNGSFSKILQPDVNLKLVGNGLIFWYAFRRKIPNVEPVVLLSPPEK